MPSFQFNWFIFRLTYISKELATMLRKACGVRYASLPDDTGRRFWIDAFYVLRLLIARCLEVGDRPVAATACTYYVEISQVELQVVPL